MDKGNLLRQKRLNLIERMSGLAGPPPGYIDQQRGYTQAKLALALLRCGRANEAAIARDAFMKTHFAAKPEGADEIVPTFLRLVSTPLRWHNCALPISW